MDLGTVIKCVLIVALIFAGYHVVSSAGAKRREGFSLGGSSSSSSASTASSGDTPSVTAGKSVAIVNTNMQNMLGLLQINNGRQNYESLVDVMDAWIQSKVISSLNALAAQMIADSSDQNSMMSPPSDKTVALMNAMNTMMNLQTTGLPTVMKYIDHA
jgi:hypothetical protein